MDAALLTDPGFWVDGGEPLAMATPPVDPRRFTELEGHVLFQTSGSSGHPQWIALSKGALLLSAAAVNRHLQVDEEACWGLALPLHHVGGFGVVARAFEAACRWERFPARWEPRAFTAWLADQRVTHLSLVPTQVHDLVAAELQAPGTLQAVVVGGGRMECATGTAARNLGWPVLASYGMTEAASQIATQPLESLHQPWQSAPLPLLSIWDARVDAAGQLQIAGPALFTGRLSRGDAGWEFLPRREAWHGTADRAALARRLLTPLGRADGLVKVLGELVDPADIERVLGLAAGGRLRPGSFAVLALADARMEHRLVPVFASEIPADQAAAALAAYHRDAPGFLRLGAPVWVDAIPTGELGKIRRAELGKLLA
jgi:o-succinylbenzoate---CoA ligase